METWGAINYLNKKMQNEDTIVKKVLQSEITWLIILVSAIMAFVYNVIIPLNTMQFQLIQIQNDIASIKSYDARIIANSNDILILKQKVNELERK